MKKIPFFMIVFVVIPLYSIAQDVQSKIHEVGINFSGLNNFGIRYKCGNEKTLLRLTFLSINGNTNNSKPDSLAQNSSSIGFGFNLGFEKRKSINDKLDYYYGLDLLNSYYSNSNNDIQSKYKYDSWSITPGLGFVLGLNYKINNQINISAELIPAVEYSYGKSTYTNNTIETKRTNTRFNYGLSNSGANLTLAYRFGNKN